MNLKKFKWYILLLMTLNLTGFSQVNLDELISNIASQEKELNNLQICFSVEYSRLQGKGRTKPPKRCEYVWYLSGKRMRLDRISEITQKQETLGIFDGEKYIILFYFQDLPEMARKQIAKTYKIGDITQVQINSFNMPTMDECLGRMDLPLAYLGLGIDLGMAQASKLVSEILKDYKVKIEGTEKVDGQMCYVLDIKKEESMEGTQGGKVLVDRKKLWIDPSIAYKIRKREDYTQSGWTIFSLSCKDFKEFKDSIWLPQKVELKYFRYDKDKQASVPFVMKTLVVQECKVNEDLPDTIFSLEQLPKGITVWDIRTDRAYKSGQKLATDEDVLEVARIAEGFLKGTVSLKDLEARANEGQTESYSCGPNALLAVCGILGVKTSSKEIAKLAGTDEKGFTSMAGLKKAAEALGLKAEGVDITIDELRKSKKLAIAFVPPDHYIVVVGFSDDKVVLIDPPTMLGAVPIFSLDTLWDGRALLISKP